MTQLSDDSDGDNDNNNNKEEQCAQRVDVARGYCAATYDDEMGWFIDKHKQWSPRGTIRGIHLARLGLSVYVYCIYAISGAEEKAIVDREQINRIKHEGIAGMDV